jgi:hypothetical protein
MGVYVSISIKAVQQQVPRDEDRQDNRNDCEHRFLVRVRDRSYPASRGVSDTLEPSLAINRSLQIRWIERVHLAAPQSCLVENAACRRTGFATVRQIEVECPSMRLYYTLSDYPHDYDRNRMCQVWSARAAADRSAARGAWT